MAENVASPTRMSARGRALLAEWEGVELREYKDAAGFPTIGVGHLLKSGEIRSGTILIRGALVPYTDGISRADALDLLAEDLDTVETPVARAVKTTLTQPQFDVLVSFTFNLGAGAFLSSTLLKRVNARAFDAVPAELRRWVNAGGRRLQGLVNRREKESALWERGYEAAENWRPR